MIIAEKQSIISTNNATIAGYVPKVYNKGKSEGYDEGYSEGYDKGYADGKAEGGGDDFWDLYQDYGNRTAYNNVFSGPAWNDVTFKPKYDITPVGAAPTYNIFEACKITDLKQILEDCGVVLDTSRVSYCSNMFQESSITRIGELNFSNASAVIPFSGCSKLQSVDKLILSNTSSQNFSAQSFASCASLTHIIFEGVIRTGTLNMKDCVNLDGESIDSIISCLSDDTSGLSVTVSKAAVDKDFETSEGANDGSTSAQWLALIATKSNWTVSLV